MDGEVMPKQKKQGGVTRRGFDFHAVPEGCIAAIAAFTTPIDACRLAVVSRDFKSASESDVVWESFLPAYCDLIVSRSDSGEAVLNECKTKKQLYMLLADRPLLFQAATKDKRILEMNSTVNPTTVTLRTADDGGKKNAAGVVSFLRKRARKVEKVSQ